MKKVLRKLCVFLLAVTFFWKSLYGDIQYARADEFAGSDVTVTEGNSEDVIIGEDETPLEDDIVPADGDVSEGDRFPRDDLPLQPRIQLCRPGGRLQRGHPGYAPPA